MDKHVVNVNPNVERRFTIGAHQDASLPQGWVKTLPGEDVVDHRVPLELGASLGDLPEECGPKPAAGPR